VNDEELKRWFRASKELLETAYLAGAHPWQESGVGLHTPHSAHDWEVLRRPIADCLAVSGTFLDTGCANGYLLECVLRWARECGLRIDPYGLDFSEKLADLARRRLPQYADHIFVGNAWDWLPPRTFDAVNTALDYVPDELQEAFVQRLLERFVRPGGRLLIAEYLGRSTGMPEMRIDEKLRHWGLPVERTASSSLEHDPVRQTRVAVIRTAGNERLRTPMDG